jgi:hypothetical protein
MGSPLNRSRVTAVALVHEARRRISSHGPALEYIAHQPRHIDRFFVPLTAAPARTLAGGHCHIAVIWRQVAEEIHHP